MNKQEKLEIIHEMNENEPYVIKINDQEAQSSAENMEPMPKLTAKFKVHSHKQENNDSFEESESASSHSSGNSPYEGSNVAKAHTSSA